MCTVLNFYLSDTKRKRRVGFIMLSRKSAQPDVSRKCSLAEFHEEMLHQRPEGWIPQICPLQNPSVALPQYHLLGDQTTAAFDFQVSGATCIRLTPFGPVGLLGVWRFLSPTFSIDLLHIYL